MVRGLQRVQPGMKVKPTLVEMVPVEDAGGAPPAAPKQSAKPSPAAAPARKGD
jgi:hypothetical protein